MVSILNSSMFMLKTTFTINFTNILIKLFFLSYRAAISPYKLGESRLRSNDNSKSLQSTGAFKENVSHEFTLSSGFNSKNKSPAGQRNPMSYSTCSTIAPSEELVQLLKRRGFSFSNV